MIYASLQKDNIKENWATVTGRITSFKEREVVTKVPKDSRERREMRRRGDNNKAKRCDFTLSYAFKNKDYTERGTMNSSCLFNKGEEIEIYVNPEDPHMFWFEGYKF